MVSSSKVCPIRLYHDIEKNMHERLRRTDLPLHSAGDGFRVDESALTGESDELRKSPTGDPVLLSGSKVMEGSGRMLVVAVGERSQQGIVTRLIRERSDESVDSEQTPLQGKLAKLAEQIGYFGFAAGAVCTVGAAIDFTYTTFVTNGASWDISYLAQYVRFLINGTAIVVVAVPEGLPLAVTLALAVSVQRMLADRNLVRSLLMLSARAKPSISASLCFLWFAGSLFERLRDNGLCYTHSE
jgi:magnesium-transporting ATPase (P-type)